MGLSSLHHFAIKYLPAVLLFTFLMSANSNRSVAQINVALTATPAHSAGGGSGVYAPSNYNDGVITPVTGCADAATPWGWTTTAGQLSYTWSSPATFNKIVFYKSNRAWTSASVWYWDGAAYQLIQDIVGTGICPEDSISFPPVTTTELVVNNFAGASNPNHREIQVWFTSTATCTSPTAQPTTLMMTPGLYTASGAFTAPASAPDRYLVVRTTSSTPPSPPIDGTNYTPGTSALGGTIVSLNSGPAFTATGLTPGTTYWFWVYSANVICSGGPLYYSTSPLSGNVTTNTCSLSGVKTVGPTGDYPTLAAAITAVNNNGLAGPLALELQTTYSGAGETFPITIDSIACSNASRKLTIRPQGTLTVTASASRLFVLNGTRNLVIDGRVGSTGSTQALTISNTNTTGSNIVFQNDASNNIVRYCKLESVNTSTANASILFSTTTGITGSDNNLIEYCDIKDGTTQPIYGILSAGTADKENSENTISNCNIYNFFMPATTSAGIMLNAGTSAWTISNNRLFQDAARAYTGTAAQRAIAINNVDGINFQVTGNIIGYASSTGTGTYTFSSSAATPFIGILLDVGNAVTSTVGSNTVTAINYSTTSGLLTGISVTDGNVDIVGNTVGASTGTGAIVKTNSTTSSPAVVGIGVGAATPDVVNVQNNFVGSITANGSSATIGAGIIGIQATSTASTTITGNVIGSTTTANSINSATASTGTQLVYGISAAIASTTTAPPDISNNTIANINAEGTGTASFCAGILFSSTSSGNISGNLIRNISSASANTALTGQAGVSGIVYTGTTGTATITQNTINAIIAKNTGTIVSNAAGISYTGSVDGSITRNRIYDIRNLSTYTTSVTTPPKAIGIFCYNPSGSVTIANNMVSLGNGLTNNTSFTGIMQGGTSSAATIRVYFNTVNIEGTVTTGAMHSVALLRGNYSTTAYTTPFDVRNNIFVNTRSGGTGKHYAIVNNFSTTGSGTGWGTNASNYNILNTANAANVGFWGADKTFATWKTSSLSDENSYTASTITFTNTSTGDLHINMGTTANNIESHGTIISGFTTDYDNQVRPGPTAVNGGGTAPDLGADEFDGVPNDNLPPTITYTPLAGGCGTGNQQFTATIADYSGVPTTTTRPRVYYRKGAGTWFSQPGTLTSGTTTNGVWTFTIVATDMGGLASGDVVSYYVVAQDNISLIGSVPSTGLVATNVNTITTHPTTPNSFTVLPSMNGIYNVGVSGTYTTITAAVNAYNAACLSGPVTFNLTDATYPAETLPITINANVFAGAGTMLTIRPASGTAVVIDGGATSTAIFKLVNAKYVTIDGVNTGGASLTLNSNNTGANAVVWLASSGAGCNNVSVKNTNINGGDATVTTNFGILSSIDAATPATTAGADNDNITIQGNTIRRCYYGIYGNGTSSGSAGGLNNWTISSNTIGPASAGSTDIGGFGINIGNALALSIANNTIRNVNTTASATALLRLNTNVNGFTISGNTLESSSSSVAASGVSTFAGMYFGTAVINGTVSGNTVRGLANTNTGGYGVRALLLNTANNTSNIVLANNMISNLEGLSDASTTALYAVMGIDIEGTTGGVKVYYNSVNLGGSHLGLTTATQSICFFTNTAGGGIDVRDNIFRNSYDNTSSVLDKGWAIYSLAPATAFSNVNYNDYSVAPGTGLMGFIAAADRTTLSAIQTYFGGNANSISVNPVFNSETDLHLQIDGDNVPLIAGTPLAGTTTDFDGTTRNSTTPVIGAHEVNIPPCNIVNAGTISATTSAMCVSGSTAVSVAGSTVGIGISRQWQSSTDSLSWTPIAGSTSLSYTTPVITGTTYYRLVISCSLSVLKDSVTKKIAINPNPLPITGTTSACVGNTGSLTTTSTGGTWSSENPAAVTISSAGVATAVAAGNSKISYTFTATGCATTTYFSVTTPPAAPVITPSATAICTGTSANLVASSAATGTADFLTGTINVAVPDNSNVGTYITLPASLPAGAIITGVSVNFNITTTFVGDLNINLSAPNGKTLNLFNMHGDDGLNFVNTTVSSAGTADFASSAAPYTGVYAATAASGDLGAAGYPVNTTSWDSLYSIPSGSWRLSARDNGPADLAFITSWKLTIDYKVPVALTWSPVSNLYTDAGTATSYTGTDLASIYAAPTAPGSSATINTYTVTGTAANCSVTSATAVTVTANPLPAVITGPTMLCEGLQYNLANADPGGTWTSSTNTVATVGSGTGLVSAIVPGTSTIAYAFTGTGCVRETVVTVNSLPAAIGGTASVCEAATTTLTNATPGGTWSSGSTFVATAGSASGVVSGISAGISVITYMLPNGCLATVHASVNPLPVNSVSPTTATICEGESVNFTGTSSLPDFSLLSQNFNAGLGGWSVDNISGNAASAWKITSAPTSGATGDGSPMLDASAQDFGGVTHTILTSPSFSTVGFGAATLTFNQYIFSLSSSDLAADVEYSVNGTGWNPLSSQLDSVSASPSWSISSPNVTVALPSDALGVADVRLRWKYHSNFGLYWDIDNISVKAALVPASPSWAGISGATDLSCTNCGSVSVTPAVSGMNTYNFTATTPAGCASSSSVSVSVNPLPGVITGAPATLCEGVSVTLGNSFAGGSWSSNNPIIASVNASTGVATGVNAGTVILSYTLPTTCLRTVTMTINPSPAAIGGTLQVCEGLTTTLTNSVSGGTWNSGNTIAATIAASGVASGIDAGNSAITYTLPAGCTAMADLTVNGTPAAIMGALEVCEGMTTNLLSATTGGTWMSLSPAVAGVGITAGTVSGIMAGSSTVVYELPTGCKRSAQVTVNALPADITGVQQVCEGLVTVLSSATTGGTWFSSNTPVATIDPSGVVSGVVFGTTSISYTLSTGCYKTAEVIVNPLPAPIAGTMEVCEGLATTLSSATTGGIWFSNNIPVAPINFASGAVTAGTAGTSGITYTLPTGCMRTAEVTVNALPADITGTMEVCEGLTTNLATTSTGGTWISGNLPVAGVDVTGVVSGIAAGNANITYMFPSTGCLKTANVTVNALPGTITGALQVCESLTTTLGNSSPGGTWASGVMTVATVDPSTGVASGIAAGAAAITYTLPTGCMRSEFVTVNELPADITGAMQVCEGLTASVATASSGGNWSSDNITVAGVDAAGVITGGIAGNANIMYTFPTGCMKMVNFTVNALPAAIGGSAEVCEGATTTLTNTSMGGTWTSDIAVIASVDAMTGIASGIVAGTTAITYTLPTGCLRATELTVNALPADISGTLEVCEGSSINLATTSTGGAWSSDHATVAGVDASGTVSGGVAGSAGIVYSFSTGCSKMVTVTVNGLPAPISGTTEICEGAIATLASATVGGSWTSSASAVADAGLLSGVVTGMSSGNATITYALMTGCLRTAGMTVNALPAVITGTQQVCAGLTTALGSATTGGAWTNDISGSATVDAAGIVTGTVAGISAITYTLPVTGCMRTVDVSVNALPDVHNVTGGGAYCAGTPGAAVGADGSQLGVNYQLYFGGSPTGAPFAGTGAPFSIGGYTAAGTYTILAFDAVTGCESDMTGSAVISITSVVIPSVALSTGSSTVCASTLTSFVASPVNGGTLPVYNWQVNGLPVPGVSAATFNYIPVNGDIVTVELNSNAACAIPATATDALTMTVNPNQMPVATISVPNTTVCNGSIATFSVAPTYGGTAPTYEWFTNSTSTGFMGTSYTYVPSNGDVVMAKMTSNFTCRLADVVSSNSLTMATSPLLLPLVTIAVSPGVVIASGTSVTFTAVVSGAGGATPSYQWILNGTVLPAATNSTYTSSTLHNNDSVTCRVMISDPCGFENFNSVIMRVKPVGVLDVDGKSEVVLIPNPNNGDFVVKGTLPTGNEDVTIDVVNMLGQVVFTGLSAVKNGGINQTIHLQRTLANGMYMLNIHTLTGHHVLHFVLEQ